VVAPGSGRPAIQAGRGSGVIMSMRTNVIRAGSRQGNPTRTGHGLMSTFSASRSAIAR
jgi:hypothetical protein